MTIQVSAPANYADELRDIVRSEPGAVLQDDGKAIFRRFTITGPDRAIEALRPKVEAWEHDLVSRDAW
jgi:hypothetical protein